MEKTKNLPKNTHMFKGKSNGKMLYFLVWEFSAEAWMVLKNIK